MSRPVEPDPYQSLDAWLAASNRRDPLSGDAYIASHVWDSDNYKTEIFGESPIGDDGQARSQTFLDRDTSWSGVRSERKAKWIEIVGGIGLKGDRPAWLDTLCKRLNTVFDRAREGGRQSQVRDTVDVTTVVHYGHVVHVRYGFDVKRVDVQHVDVKHVKQGFDWVDLDVFVLPTNEIITVYARRLVSNVPSTLMADHYEHPCPPLQELVNAATVLWRFEVLLTEVVMHRYARLEGYQLQPAVPLKKGTAYNPVLTDEINWEVKQPLEQINDVYRHLVKSQRDWGWRWLEPDLKAEFERRFQHTQHILRGVQQLQSEWEAERHSMEIVQAGESRRIAQRQESIAAERAQSAVVLNRLLAVFTACTVIVVPFTMTAAFFSMQKFDDTPNLSIHKFKIIVGYATGAILAAGFLLTNLLRNWRGVLRRLDNSIGYEEWREKRMSDRIKELHIYLHNNPKTDSSEKREYERLQSEWTASCREKEKYEASKNDLDFSRRRWAENHSQWSAFRKGGFVRREAKKGLSKLGGCLRGPLGMKGSSGRASTTSLP